MTPYAAPSSLTQVLVLGDPENARSYGRAVWSALHEIEGFYVQAELLRGPRHYVFEQETFPQLQTEWAAERRQTKGTLSSFLAAIRHAVPGASVHTDRPDPAGGTTQVAPPEFWQSAQGRYAQTVSQQDIYTVVRQALAGEQELGPVVVFTDQEIAPPPGFRYLLWDRMDAGAVISTAPMDPQYWGEKDDNRVTTIKQRARAAGMCVAGALLGLSRCGNDSCYLYANVDSVTALDTMVQLGKEHGDLPVTGRGYEPRSPKPEGVQELMDHPLP